MEASAITAPAGISRLPLATPLLRLRSDEQLLAAFRHGNESAFDVLHDRYRQRLFAYVRQMLSAATRQDAEDVLQDVFVRAYAALRADAREMNVRAWLYRVAHNRCIDHLRRPLPPAAEIFEVSRKPLRDPVEEAQRREDLARLVEDISRLPDQQRSALLMREIDGLSYRDLAEALDATVPAIKSLLVRARVGLVDAAQARDADCLEIHAELLDAYDRGVKASGHARRHMRTCTACTDYRAALRTVQRSFASLTPAGLGPLAFATKLLGLSSAGGGAAAGGGALAGGGAVAGATACKVAAVVCTAALAGGAVEADHLVRDHHPAPRPRTVAHHTIAHHTAAPSQAAAHAPALPAGSASLQAASNSAPATEPTVQSPPVVQPAVPPAGPLTDAKRRSVEAAQERYLRNPPPPMPMPTPDYQPGLGGSDATPEDAMTLPAGSSPPASSAPPSGSSDTPPSASAASTPPPQGSTSSPSQAATGGSAAPSPTATAR